MRESLNWWKSWKRHYLQDKIQMLMRYLSAWLVPTLTHGSGFILIPWLLCHNNLRSFIGSLAHSCHTWLILKYILCSQYSTQSARSGYATAYETDSAMHASVNQLKRKLLVNIFSPVCPSPNGFPNFLLDMTPFYLTILMLLLIVLVFLSILPSRDLVIIAYFLILWYASIVNIKYIFMFTLPGVVVHIFHPSTQEAEARGSLWVWGQ